MKKLGIIIGIVIVIVGAFVLFIFNSKYLFVLNGDSVITLNLNDSYEELGARTIFGQKLEADGNVDTSKIGEYVIAYYCGKNHIDRIVKVIDTTKPEITINGQAEINVAVNGQYIEKGATAIDNYDGDITDKIVIDNTSLDLENNGSYKIIYSVIDSSGNKEETERIVNVSDQGPLTMGLEDFNLNGYFEDTILKETEDKGQEYLDETVFYGDSITFNFAYYGQLKWESVWAMSSLTPENAHTWDVPFYKYNGEKISLINGLKKYQPKRVIITLGANAVAVTTKDFFIQKYEELIIKAKEASPNTILIVQSIFPIDSRYKGTSLNNAKINNYNYYLAEMCERHGAYFLNTASILKDGSGHMKKGYAYNSDGIHPLPAANREIMNYIRKHGV